LSRNFPVCIYFFYLFLLLFLLFLARKDGLLPMPPQGTDQLSMLEAAAGICRGKMPDAGYMYSPSYTLFLALICKLASGDIVLMRILQALLCAFIPVFIYKLARLLLFGKNAALLSAFIYCFYGPALLISLDFLRAAPLALCFLLFAYYSYKAILRKNHFDFFITGIMGGLCILGRENFLAVIFSVPILVFLFKDIRKHISLFNAGLFSIGIIFILLPILTYNRITHGAFSIVPGHVNNVLGAYHGDLAVADKIIAVKSILLNIPIQFFNFISSYEIPNSLSFYAHRDVMEFLKIFFVPFNMIFAFSFTALFFKWKNKSIIFLWLLAGTYIASMLFFHIFYRFRIPVVPILCILAGVGIMRLWRAIKKREIYKSLSSICFLAFFAFITFRDADKLRPAGERRTVALFLIEKGFLQKAETYIQKMKSDGIQTEMLEEYLHNKEIEIQGK
ncbi:MAG: glycosyltransferase family 39 protein, partial [Candidatus Nanoarchaeia archaeon]